MRTRIGNSVLMVLTLSLLGSLSAKADGVVGGSWYSWSTSILNSPGTGAYWNNNSSDGSKYNIGWCLAGGGNCIIPNPPGNIPFLSSGSGNAPSNFYLTNTGSGDAGTLVASITNNSSHDFFGWYNLVNNTPVLHPLLVGNETNMTVVFTPTANYGFYFQDQVNGGSTWFTQTSYEASKDDGFQAFALFQQTAGSNYWLGVEDGGIGGDKDYQDMIIHLASVPEPASVVLLGGSLLMMGGFIRRRNRSTASR